jgi:hypothetical protein
MFTKTANWLLLGLTLIVAAVLALFMLIKSQDRIADLELAPTAIVDRQGNYHRITWLDEQTLLIEVAEPQFIPVVNTRIWTLDTESLEMRRVDLPDYPGCSDTAFSIPMALGDGRLGYIAICRKWPELRMPHYMMAYDLRLM